MANKSDRRHEIYFLFGHPNRADAVCGGPCGVHEDQVQLTSDSQLSSRQNVQPLEQRKPGAQELTITRKQLWRPPYFILAVSVVQVLVFLWGDSLELSLVFDPHRRLQVWRFASYMLVHTNGLHLALNVAIQCFLALPLEDEQGVLRTATVYVGGGVGGALATSALQPKLYILGGSAGVYALLISHVANIVLNWDVLRYIGYRSVAVLVIAAADVVFSIYHASMGNVCPRIGWTAHLAGAFAGLLVGVAFFRGAGHTPGPVTRYVAKVFTIAVLVMGGLAGLAVNVVYALPREMG